MKKFLFLMLTILVVHQGYSQKQSNPQGEPVTTKRFSAGIHYSYLSVDMELSAMTLHSVWFGSDAGTEEKSQEQIDEINGYVDRYSRVNAICVELGMILLDKPEVHWKLKGSLFGGLAENLITVTNNTSTVKEYSFNSGFSKPYIGLEFDLGYQFTGTWGVIIRPLITGTMGKSSTIVDHVNPDMLNFTASKENTYRTVYGKISMLAGYSIKKFSVYAGPGFYRIWSHHQYKRLYTQNEEWESISEDLTNTIVSRNFLDGNIAALWRISDRFSMNVLCGIGNDISINGGVQFNF